jgi:hypothetical protein
MYKKKTIVVGLGKIGFLYDEISNLKKKNLSHVKSIVEQKNLELVCGVEKKKYLRLKFEKKYNISAESSLDVALNKYDPELVIVSSNTNTHLKIIKKIVKNKSIKQIILEKPGGKSYDQLKKILFLCKKNNKKLLLNYTRLFVPYFQNIIKILKNRNLFCIFQYNRGVQNNCSHLISFLFSISMPKKISDIKIDMTSKSKKGKIFLKWNNIECLLVNPGIKNLDHTKVEIFTKNSHLISDNTFSFFKIYKREKSDFYSSYFKYDNEKILKNKFKNIELQFLYKDIDFKMNKCMNNNKISLYTSQLVDKIKFYDR